MNDIYAVLIVILFQLCLKKKMQLDNQFYYALYLKSCYVMFYPKKYGHLHLGVIPSYWPFYVKIFHKLLVSPCL